MSTVVILGAGVSGHTAALYLRTKLSKTDRVVVVTPNSLWNWLPSNVWVGVGKMDKEDVTFSLAEIYKKKNIEYVRALAKVIHPEGDSIVKQSYIEIEYTDQNKVGQIEKIEYDYLINATGPKLNFDATPGLGPDHFTESICTYSHAMNASKKVDEAIEQLKNGKDKLTFVVGTGHGTCTCQGAAFEYLLNLEQKLRQAGVRDKSKLIWISNEFELGDFGMGGVFIRRGGYITNSKVFTESVFRERGIEWITQSHVVQINKDTIFYDTLRNEEKEIKYDFAMLLPPFSGVGLTAIARDGQDITSDLFQPNGFMKVDADYTPKKYEDWEAKDWPETYQSPVFKNIFAVGIAFAPPHTISKPMKNALGTNITPAPPRTGMPSAVSGKAVAFSVAEMIKKKTESPKHKASMAHMGASCVASAGTGFFTGSAATMTVFPIVQDFKKYPEYGRDLDLTFGEIGLAGHWIKTILHYMFIYKAKGKPGWSWIPE